MFHPLTYAVPEDGPCLPPDTGATGDHILACRHPSPKELIQLHWDVARQEWRDAPDRRFRYSPEEVGRIWFWFAAA